MDCLGAVAPAALVVMLRAVALPGVLGLPGPRQFTLSCSRAAGHHSCPRGAAHIHVQTRRNPARGRPKVARTPFPYSVQFHILPFVVSSWKELGLSTGNGFCLQLWHQTPSLAM